MRRFWKVLLIAAALSGLGATCGRDYVPAAELASARQSIVDAQYLPSLKYCPHLLAEAQQHLRLADEAMAKKDFDTALAEANKAHRTAEDIKRCRADYTNPVLER